MKAKNMALCALFAGSLAICAWLSLPVGDIAYTLQTFGVFLALGILGGKQGTVAILVYLLLGAVGLPVFSGFRGGPGILFGVTGGYILGFLAAGLVYWGMTAWKNTSSIRLIAMLAGLLACYCFGSVWFWGIYLSAGSTIGLGAVLLKCVVPYLLPDILKLALAFWLSKKLSAFV